MADAGTSAPAEGGEGGNGEGTGADAGEGAAAGNGAPQEEGAAAGTQHRRKDNKITLREKDFCTSVQGPFLYLKWECRQENKRKERRAGMNRELFEVRGNSLVIHVPEELIITMRNPFGRGRIRYSGKTAVKAGNLRFSGNGLYGQLRNWSDHGATGTWAVWVEGLVLSMWESGLTGSSACQDCINVFLVN